MPLFVFSCACGSARHCFHDIPMTLVLACRPFFLRYARKKRARSPHIPGCRMTMRGGAALHGAPRSRLRRARIVSTPCYYRKQHALTEKPPDFSGGFRHVLPGAVNGRRRAKIFFTPGRRLARRQIDRYYGVFVTISCSDMRFSVYVWNHWLQRTSACGSSSD